MRLTTAECYIKQKKRKNQGGTARKNLSAPESLRFELVPNSKIIYGTETKGCKNVVFEI